MPQVAYGLIFVGASKLFKANEINTTNTLMTEGYALVIEDSTTMNLT
jgi:hypothetical protein